MIIEWWQVRFHIDSIVIRVVSHKYTSWMFTSEFKLKIAIKSLKVIADTLNKKIERGHIK
jgi:hypothetical protein